MLVSAVQQSESAIRIFPPSWASLPLPHSIPLSHDRALSWTSVLYSSFPLAINFTHGSVCVRGFPSGSHGKESACSAGDLGSIPGSGRPPGERNGYPLQYSCLKNSMDGGAWHVNPNLPIPSLFTPHLHVHMSVLYLCVFVPALYSCLLGFTCSTATWCTYLIHGTINNNCFTCSLCMSPSLITHCIMTILRTETVCCLLSLYGWFRAIKLVLKKIIQP